MKERKQKTLCNSPATVNAIVNVTDRDQFVVVAYGFSII
jgi:hypothetical protein